MTYRVLVAGSALALSACTGTDVGNPVVDIDLAVHGGAPGGLTVTDGWVSVERIRLRDAATCSGGTELDLDGPFAVDLLATGAIPELTDLDVRATDYCRFELRWHVSSDALPPDAPAELDGAAILFQGTRGDGTPFVLRSERNDELRLDAVGGAFPIDDATFALFVGLDAARLFDGVDLDGAVVGGDGVIRIENGSNDDVLSAFDDNVVEAADLFDDDDGDGDLGAGETDPDDVLAD